MAYVTLDALTQIAGAAPNTENKLKECTPAQLNQPAYYPVEDIIKITEQPGFDSLKKFMATFWNHTYQVWVGLTENNEVLTKVVALRCPPYYEPFSFPGIDISELKDDIPEGFPNPDTLPPVVS